MQAHLIYIIMCVVGEAKHAQNWNQTMLLTFEVGLAPITFFSSLTERLR